MTEAYLLGVEVGVEDVVADEDVDDVVPNRVGCMSVDLVSDVTVTNGFFSSSFKGVLISFFKSPSNFNEDKDGLFSSFTDDFAFSDSCLFSESRSLIIFSTTRVPAGLSIDLCLSALISCWNFLRIFSNCVVLSEDCDSSSPNESVSDDISVDDLLLVSSLGSLFNSSFIITDDTAEFDDDDFVSNSAFSIFILLIGDSFFSGLFSLESSITVDDFIVSNPFNSERICVKS